MSVVSVLHRKVVFRNYQLPVHLGSGRVLPVCTFSDCKMELAWTRVCEISGVMWEVAWNRDATKVAIARDRGRLRILEVATGEYTDIELPADALYGCIAWHPDSTHIALAMRNDVAMLLDCATHELRVLCTARDMVWNISWRPDGAALAIAFPNTVVILHPFAGEECPPRTYQHGSTHPESMSWSPSGKKIALSGRDVLYVWDDLETPSRGPRTMCMWWEILAIEWAGTEESLAVSCQGAILWIVRLDTWTARALTAGHCQSNYVIWGCRDRPQILCHECDGTCTVSDQGAGKTIARMPALPGSSTATPVVEWSSDGTAITAYGWDNVVYVCRLPPAVDALAQETQALAVAET